ncbi:MAG TPA: GAF domain-containing sensor histidine kinase [Anaeromyxobacteraceae bacterium]|nr:GAF domain-containing sensor histidine kinase [Anaeromyxobacteraceae bacterium]
MRRSPALAELRQAKETVAALSRAGTRLLGETDESVMVGVICQELVKLGFQSAILTGEPYADDPPVTLRWSASSFDAPVQAVTEKILGHALADIRVSTVSAPLFRRVLASGRTVYSERPWAAAREIFGCGDRRKLARLQRVLGLEHSIFAPLRCAGRNVGILAVAARRLRRSDPEAIDAFADQASMALDKARLIAELKGHQAHLEAEVRRRTEELTRAVAALKEMDRRKDNFLANVSHELRTPLVTVLGYSDLLLSDKLGELSPRQRDCLRIVAGSGRRLRSFIDELLEFSRWELKDDQLDRGAVDVRDLLRTSALSVAPRFAQRGISLRWRVAARTPAIHGDRDRLIQVVTNLLNNAERHNEAGGHVHAFAAPLAGGRVGVTVADDGRGIPGEHLGRIFDRLYQVDDTTRQRGRGSGGLGLGLAIVKNIVEAHGGSVEVRSRVGRGTAFRLTLPAVSAAPVETRNSGEAA